MNITSPAFGSGYAARFLLSFFRIKLGCVYKIGGTAYAIVSWQQKEDSSMDTTIIAAIITATTSIIVAIIQARSTEKQAPFPRQQFEPRPRTIPPEQQWSLPQNDSVKKITPSKSKTTTFQRKSNLKVWFWLIVFMVIEAVLLPQVFEAISFINVLLIPLVTIRLATLRPLPWGWAAVFVAILHAFNYLGYYWSGGYFSATDMQNSLIFYIINVLVVSSVAKQNT